jgi:hypothetical protein
VGTCTGQKSLAWAIHSRAKLSRKNPIESASLTSRGENQDWYRYRVTNSDERALPRPVGGVCAPRAGTKQQNKSLVAGRDPIGGRGKIIRRRQKQVVAGELRTAVESISSGDIGPGRQRSNRRQRQNHTEAAKTSRSWRAENGGKSISSGDTGPGNEQEAGKTSPGPVAAE